MLKHCYIHTQAGPSRGDGILLAIIWEGATAAGDTCSVYVNGEMFWQGRTDTTQTYLGVSFGSSGIPVSTVNVHHITAGSLYIYYGGAV